MEEGRSATVESLELSIIVDNYIVEIHANDIFALSTQVWPWFENSTKIVFFTAGGSQKINVRYSDIMLYEGLVSAWPGRQQDISK